LKNLYDNTLWLIITLNETGKYCPYSEKDLDITFEYNNIIKIIYDLQKIYDVLVTHTFEENNI